MVLNFTRFVKWPQGAFSAPETPLTICVAGEEPFLRDLETAAHGKSVFGHPFKVINGEDQTSAACHVLYLPQSQKKYPPAISRPGTLTVGDADRFARSGGMIGLMFEGGNLRFEVNLAASSKAGLILSSKLLKVASATFQSAEGPR